MKNQEINPIATSLIAFFAFLATWGAIVNTLNLKWDLLIIISEIYILSTLLFINWIKGEK